MIRRLSVKNYRSLVDFTWEPGPESLVLGANGSGKSTAIDALNLIRNFACGWESLQNLFDADDVTMWAQGEIVSFELDLQAGGSPYRYKVAFEWSKHDRALAVVNEELHRGNYPVFVRQLEIVSTREGETWAGGPYAPSNQSVLAPMHASPEAGRVDDVFAALERMIVVRPVPPLMRVEARQLTGRPELQFENFVAWYWALSGNSRVSQPLSEMLRGVWPEFDSVLLSPLGHAMVLSVWFGRSDGPKKAATLEFQQLSDGEQMLIALYSLAAYQQVTEPTTIIIDEPDNFVSSAELQPWLLKMLDDRPDGGQIILVSHNPEIIDTMGESRVDYFERADHMSTTRVRKIPPDDTGLSLSERITRGWVGE
jgi:predicted ATPase